MPCPRARKVPFVAQMASAWQFIRTQGSLEGVMGVPKQRDYADCIFPELLQVC